MNNKLSDNDRVSDNVLVAAIANELDVSLGSSDFHLKRLSASFIGMLLFGNE